MSWEYSKYEARCEHCGRQGFCVKGSDDWYRFSTFVGGFANREPNLTAVGRKRTDRRDNVPLIGPSLIELRKT
jgi:hypothetical protein